MTRMTISLSEEEAERLRREARMLRVSVSQLVRDRLFRGGPPQPPRWVGIIRGTEGMTSGAEAKRSIRETWSKDLKRRET
ncbi:MAG TPA: ribbon-helix-helix protein, CopG family [Tepidiformaceae bacterium]|nr:ribbon-helix-helix protein, CopG family [Tepidiformaceae bacterium]